MENYLTEGELAERLKVSRSFLWNLRRQGLPFVQIGRTVRYLSQNVDSWLAVNCQGKTVSNLDKQENE